MSDNTKNDTKTNSRRQVLKATLAGTGAVIAGKSLPEQWSRPVVDSIVLPGHAQTSLVSITGGALLSVSVAELDDSLLDGLLPRAHAQVSSVSTAVLCFGLNGDGTVDVRILLEIHDDGCYQDVAYLTATVNQGEEASLALQNGPCFVPFSSAGIVVTITDGVASGILEYRNNDITASTRFSVSDPGCGITSIPTECDNFCPD